VFTKLERFAGIILHVVFPDFRFSFQITYSSQSFQVHMYSSALKTAKFYCVHLQKELEVLRTFWNKPEVNMRLSLLTVPLYGGQLYSYLTYIFPEHGAQHVGYKDQALGSVFLCLFFASLFEYYLECLGTPFILCRVKTMDMWPQILSFSPKACAYIVTVRKSAS